MIITRETDDRIEVYTLVQTTEGYYWKIEVKPYAVKEIKRGVTREFKDRAAAMKAVGKKIVKWEASE